MGAGITSIIDRLGGLTELAKALGHKNPTTVQGWKARGVIPIRHIPAVIEIGRAKGVDLELSDFLPRREAA